MDVTPSFQGDENIDSGVSPTANAMCDTPMIPDGPTPPMSAAVRYGSTPGIYWEDQSKGSLGRDGITHGLQDVESMCRLLLFDPSMEVRVSDL